MDSLFVDIYTDLTVLTRVDRIEQFLHVLSSFTSFGGLEDLRTLFAYSAKKGESSALTFYTGIAQEGGVHSQGGDKID